MKDCLANGTLTPQAVVEEMKRDFVTNRNLSEAAKCAAVKELSSVGVLNKISYEKKKLTALQTASFNDLSGLLQIPSVGNVSFKSGLKDDGPTTYVSLIFEFAVNHWNETKGQLYIDGTFGVVDGLQLVVIGMELEGGMKPTGSRFLPVAALFTNRKKATTYKRFFDELKAAGLQCGKDTNLVSDGELGFGKAFRSTFKAVLETNLKLCYFHISHNCVKKLRLLKFPSEAFNMVLKTLDAMHKSDVKAATERYEKFKSECRAINLDGGNDKMESFFQYFDKTHLKNAARWCGVQDEARTTNILERWNKHFKENVLKRTKASIRHAAEDLHVHVEGLRYYIQAAQPEADTKEKEKEKEAIYIPEEAASIAVNSLRQEKQFATLDDIASALSESDDDCFVPLVCFLFN